MSMKTNVTTLQLPSGITSIPMEGGFSTLPQQVTQTLAYNVELGYTGTTIAGSVFIEVSNTYNPTTHTPGNWNTVAGSPQTLSAAGTGTFNVGNGIPGYPWFRVSFTDSGSSADARMVCTANIKGF